MAAADASFDHFPMVLRPPYHTQRLEITLLQSDTIAVFFLRLVLRRRPTYADSLKPTISRLPRGCNRGLIRPCAYGATATIMHPESASRIYFIRQPLDYFPTLRLVLRRWPMAHLRLILHDNQRTSANVWGYNWAVRGRYCSSMEQHPKPAR